MKSLSLSPKSWYEVVHDMTGGATKGGPKLRRVFHFSLYVSSPETKTGVPETGTTWIILDVKNF